MLRTLLLVVLCTACTIAWGQTTIEVDDLKADFNAYGRAIKMITGSGRYQDGISVLTELIQRRDNGSQYPQRQLATFYSGRGLGYYKSGQYRWAIADYLKAIDLLHASGEGRADLSQTWYQLSLAYYYDDQKSEAMEAADKCIQTALEHFGPTHSATLDAYSLRSNYAGMYDRAEMALKDRLACFEIIQKSVERNFTYLTAAERTAYWNKNLPETTIMFAFAHKLGVGDGEFADALYNQQLLAKGLLLTAESSLQRTIDQNPDLSATYRQIRALRLKASDGKGSREEAADATFKADKLEREITSSANGLGQFLGFLGIHAEDIRQRLTSKDVAIELVDYRVGKDSVMYAALILSPRWQHVRFLPLAERQEIEHNKMDLSALVWQPIIRELPAEVTNIYFAPSGLLYQIPIESHPLADGRLVSDIYNLHRLSSTRWLAIDQQRQDAHDAVLYGDLQYDTSVAELTADMARYPEHATRSSDAGKLRGASSMVGLVPLPATRQEVESIQQILQASKPSAIDAVIHSGVEGTETSFKALSSSHKRIIHIATHGFFNDDGSAASSALQNAALCFAGADNKLQGEPIPATVNDGILTAEEVTQMDLSGLDMLTLSACETGLGTISSDGVFGLQRGFKKAGANSILMSLWKVDDEATCKLMTEFYSNWITRKMTKHDALEIAKKTVRETKGWEDPKYWAAFILLDGLD